MTAQLVYTPVEDIPKIQSALRKSFQTGKTKSLAFRKEQLLQLAYLVQDNAERFQNALREDLGRPAIESQMLEISGVINEAMEAYNHLEKWAKPEKPSFNMNWFAMRPTIRKEPKGVILIIAPFNFPVFLTLGPFIGAIASGNAVVVKPSELAPATSQLITELVPQYLDPEFYKIVNGDIPVVTQLLDLPWDHILYTGSGRVAKIVAAAAAKHLTPVSTELGGKCPVILDPKSDLKLAARRILWGKTSNAGQVCVSPDYVLVPETAQEAFIKELENVYHEFYPNDPATSDSYSRIISQAHTKRIKKYIDETKGQIVFGGEVDVEKKYIAPTVVKNVKPDDALMQDEIFGPVLPIVPVKDVDEAISFVNSLDHALSLYVFTQDSKFKSKVFDNTQSGAAVANEVILHVGAVGLPFGGIGPSGSGYHTGKYGFDMFTHLRASLDNPGWIDTYVMSGRFPPYTPEKFKSIQALLATKLPPRPVKGASATSSSGGWVLWIIFALLAIIPAALFAKKRLL